MLFDFHFMSRVDRLHPHSESGWMEGLKDGWSYQVSSSNKMHDLTRDISNFCILVQIHNTKRLSGSARISSQIDGATKGNL